MVVVLLYRVGFPQYQMVPFVLASAWLVRHGGDPGRSTAPVVAMTLHFGWIAAVDTVYMLDETDLLLGYWFPLRDIGGLPTFLLGSALLGCIVHAATPRTLRPPHRPHATDPSEVPVESGPDPVRERPEARP